MKIESLILIPYQIALQQQKREGVLVQVIDKNGNNGWGDIAPLPKLSKETLEQSIDQIHQKKQQILNINWDILTCLEEVKKLVVYPSVRFGLESAILAILKPLKDHSVPSSCLLIGSYEEILRQAAIYQMEGFTSAKLKISNHSFEEATNLIHLLKDRFFLRIDVNRAWKTEESLEFFSQFPKDAFDYVEEPFQNPKDLFKFTHPIAIDESFPIDLSIEDLKELPMLKALVYKPTIQGGLGDLIPLHQWTLKNKISLILSSCFESDLGIACVASLANRLCLLEPIGAGTFFYIKEPLLEVPLKFSSDILHIPSILKPKIDWMDKLFF